MHRRPRAHPLVLVLSMAAPPAPLAAQQSQPVIVRGGQLFDGVRDTVRPNPGILVAAGKFLAIGPAADRTDLGAVREIRLDDDEYVLPGFFDLHAHYAVDLFGRGRVDETTAYPVIFLANGVTATFPAGEVNPERMRELRLRIDRGDRIGPRLFNSGPYFGSWRRGWNPDATREDIYREVDEWAAKGVAGFKAKGITPAHLEALIARAHLHGLTVTGHLGSGYRGTVNPRDAIRMGIDRVEHFLGGDPIRGDRPAYESLERLDPDTPAFAAVVDQYLRHGVFFDATLTAYGYFGERDPQVYTYFEDEPGYLTPYMQELLARRPSRGVLEQFERIYRVKRETIKAFYDAGGGHLITLGTDHPSWGEYLSGFAVHRELQAFVLAGIPEADALKFATVNGARALDAAGYLGTVEPGKFADLVVVRGNPLTDIRNTRNVSLVMKAGITYDPRALLASVRGTIGPAGPQEITEWVVPEEAPYGGTSRRHPTGTSAIDPAGLAAAYDMETTTTGGRLADLSGNGHHGIIRGTETVEGLFGGARRFTSPADRIDLPETSALALDGPLTVAVWMRPRTLGIHQHVVACDDKFALWITPDDHLRFADTRRNAVETTDRALERDRWVSVVAVFEGMAGDTLSGDNIRMYVDGRPAPATAGRVWSPGPLYPDDACYLGFESHQGNARHQELPFRGDLDEVLVFGRALTATEARAHAARLLAGAGAAR